MTHSQAMILEIVSDSYIFDLTFYPSRLEDFWVSNARQLQYLWGLYLAASMSAALSLS